jgi:hypothetical protein
MQPHLEADVPRFCREYVRQMNLVVRTLRRLPGHPPSAELNNQLLALFRAERQ